MGNLHSTWKGILQLGLISIPVKKYTSTVASETISFNKLHADCKCRIKQKNYCPQCDKDVSNADIVKGYEHAKNQYVVMSDEELASVKVDSMDALAIEQFVPLESIDPLYIDKIDYLAPDGPSAVKSYQTLREAMGGLVGLAKLAERGRERNVAIVPYGNGILLQTLRSTAEVRPLSAIDELNTIVEVNPEEVQLAMQLVNIYAVETAALDIKDSYSDRLREIIAAKLEGRTAEPVTLKPKQSEPANMLDALRQSLAAVQQTKGKQPKVASSTSNVVKISEHAKKITGVPKQVAVAATKTKKRQANKG